MNASQRVALQEICSHVRFDTDMGACTTLRTGGRADALIDVRTVDELRELLGWLQREKPAWRIIGGGSNLLVSATGYQGALIRLKGDFREIAFFSKGAGEGECVVKVGGGAGMASLVNFCRKEGLAGLEWAAGIPGTVGGTLAMNAGAHGYDMSGVTSLVTTLGEDGGRRDWKAGELDFSYRSLSIPGKPDGLNRVVIASAMVILRYGDEHNIAERMKRYLGERREKQPKGASAGSFFKNPKGDAAGRLIEAAGLKGFSCGGAMVSPVHANFIVNTGRATPEDILALKNIVQQKVLEQSGILLEPEVHIL